MTVPTTDPPRPAKARVKPLLMFPSNTILVLDINVKSKAILGFLQSNDPAKVRLGQREQLLRLHGRLQGKTWHLWWETLVSTDYGVDRCWVNDFFNKRRLKLTKAKPDRPLEDQVETECGILGISLIMLPNDAYPYQLSYGIIALRAYAKTMAKKDSKA